MDAWKLLQSRTRYQELSREVPDSAVFLYLQPRSYATAIGTKRWSRLEDSSALSRNDISAAAEMLHEKIEIHEALRLGYELDEVVAGGPEGNPVHEEAHALALKEEYKFLQECAQSEGLETSVEALALANQLAGEISSESREMKIINEELRKNGLFEKIPSREEFERAVELFKRGGVEYSSDLKRVLSMIEFFDYGLKAAQE